MPSDNEGTRPRVNLGCWIKIQRLRSGTLIEEERVQRCLRVGWTAEMVPCGAILAVHLLDDVDGATVVELSQFLRR